MGALTEAETGCFSYSPPRLAQKKFPSPRPEKSSPRPGPPRLYKIYLLYESVIYFIVHQKQSEERTNTDKERVSDTHDRLVGFLFR